MMEKGVRKVPPIFDCYRVRFRSYQPHNIEINKKRFCTNVYVALDGVSFCWNENETGKKEGEVELNLLHKNFLIAQSIVERS